MNRAAESYVRLVLALGEHDSDYVDAYYGPDAWRGEAAAARKSIDRIRQEAEALLHDLRSQLPPLDSEPAKLRYDFLVNQLRSLVSRARMLGGERLSFDAESAALYDAVAPSHDAAYFRRVLDQLDAALPGAGSLPERYEAVRADFIIPRDRLQAVFGEAVLGSRQRTMQFLELPDGEDFELEYVSDRAWSGYNWYHGSYHSVIQVNTDLPVYIDQALDLACHEGYPGHHVHNVMLERCLTRDRGWIEFSVYPLFSPQSLLAEGTANYGIHVAFPGKERVRFESTVLYPVAGLDVTRAEECGAVRQLMRELNYAGTEVARRYLDGAIDRDGAVGWLVEFALMPRRRAQQRVAFIDRYRSYVINYTLGEDLVRKYVESGLVPRARDADRWRRFAGLMTLPRVPSGLTE